jgi:hypothetical protein
MLGGISNHGFGHIMRNISVIVWILEHTTNKIVLVTAHKHVELDQRYLEQSTKLAREGLYEHVLAVEKDVGVGVIVKLGRYANC